MSNKTSKVYRSALKEMICIYNKAVFWIVEIRCDNEYNGMLDKVEDKFQVQINYALAQEHVPEAKRNNRMLKEQYRAIYHCLPYQ